MWKPPVFIQSCWFSYENCHFSYKNCWFSYENLQFSKGIKNINIYTHNQGWQKRKWTTGTYIHHICTTCTYWNLWTHTYTQTCIICTYIHTYIYIYIYRERERERERERRNDRYIHAYMHHIHIYAPHTDICTTCNPKHMYAPPNIKTYLVGLPSALYERLGQGEWSV